MTEQDKQMIEILIRFIRNKDSMDISTVMERCSKLAHWKNKIFLKELDYLLTMEGDIDEQIRKYIKKYEDE